MSLAARWTAAICAAVLAGCAAGLADGSAAPPSLEATRWVMAGAKSDAVSPPRLEFTREGRVTGYTGCNQLGGSYRLEGDRLDVVAATTKRACLCPGGDAESRLLAVLADRPRVRLGAGKLVLTGASGTRFEFDAVK